MNIAEMRKTPHLSASGIGDYISCSLLYKFGRIDKIRPAFTPDALEFGSCVHKALQYFYEHKSAGNCISETELLQTFEQNWRESAEGRDDIEYKAGKSFEILLSEGKSLLSVYFDELPKDDYKVLAIEEAFSFEIEGIDVPIIGVYDLIEEDEQETIIITDWKTSSRAFSQSEIDRNMQLLLYQMSTKANGFSDRNILLKIDALIKTRTPKFEQYFTTREEKDEQRLIRKIQAVWDGIQKGIFIPNDDNWKCSCCSYKEYCENW